MEAERDFVRVHMNGHAHLVSSKLGEMEKARTLGHSCRPPVPPAIVRRDKVRAVLLGRFHDAGAWISTMASACRWAQNRDAVQRAFDI
jgi:hypothetical protein